MFDDLDLSAYPSFEVKRPTGSATFIPTAANPKSYNLSAFGEPRKKFVVPPVVDSAGAKSGRPTGSIDSQPLSSGSSSSISPPPFISSVGDSLEPYSIDADVICPQSGRRPLYRLKRDELLAFVRQELYCTLGSSPTGMTLHVLTSYFSDDAKEDLTQIAKMLGFCSVNEMLRSAEFTDIVEPTTADHVLGAANTTNAFCYKVVEVPRTQHIIKVLKDRVSANEAKERTRLAVLTNPANSAAILEGKLRLLRLAAELGAETGSVYFGDIQTAYAREHNVALDKSELKRHFQCGRIKDIVNNFLFEDVRLYEDTKRSGSLYLELKRPMADIAADAQRIIAEREALSGPTTAGPVHSENIIVKTENLEKPPAEDPKASQPEAQSSGKQKKYEPELVPLIRPSQFLFTDDLRVREKYTAVQKFADDFDAALASSGLGQCQPAAFETPSGDVPSNSGTIFNIAQSPSTAVCHVAASAFDYDSDDEDQRTSGGVDVHARSASASGSSSDKPASVADSIGGTNGPRRTAVVNGLSTPVERFSPTIGSNGRRTPNASLTAMPLQGMPSPAKSFSESAFSDRPKKTDRSNGPPPDTLAQSVDARPFRYEKNRGEVATTSVRADSSVDVDKYYRAFSDCLNRYATESNRRPSEDRDKQQPPRANETRTTAADRQSRQTVQPAQGHGYDSRPKFENSRNSKRAWAGKQPAESAGPTGSHGVLPNPTTAVVMREWSGSKKTEGPSSSQSQPQDVAPKKSLGALLSKIESLDFDACSVVSSSTMGSPNKKSQSRRRIHVPMARSPQRATFAGGAGRSSTVALPTSRGLKSEVTHGSGGAPITPTPTANAAPTLREVKLRNTAFDPILTASTVALPTDKTPAQSKRLPSLLEVVIDERSIFGDKPPPSLSMENGSNRVRTSFSSAAMTPSASEVEKLRSSIALVMACRNVTTMKAVEMNAALEEFLGSRPLGGLQRLVAVVREHVDFIDIRTLPTSELIFVQK